MAKQEVGLKIDVDVSSVGNIKKELRAATVELIAMQEKFGKTSEQAINAAKRVANLKDTIQDAKEQADLFDPGNKFKAFSNAATQVAAGFTAVQGAMALVGSESEDVQKSLLKVQGALALSQGLSQIGDLGKAFDELKIVAVNAFRSIKAAIGSTGIGLLVVALGAIVAYWDDIKAAVSGVSSEQKKLNEESAKNLKTQQDKLKAIGDQDNILKLQGKSEKEILQSKIKQTDETIKAAEVNLQNNIATLKAQTEAEQRNKQILEGLLKFVSLPITAILKGIDLIGSAVGKNFGLEEKFFGGLASFIFDPEETKKKGDETIKEQEKALTDLKNQRAGFQLSIQKIDQESEKKTADTQKEKDKKALEAQQAAAKVLDDARRAKLTEQQREEEDAIRKFEESKKTLLAAGKDDFKSIEEQKEIELKAIRDKYKAIQDEADKKAKEEKLKKEEEENKRLAEARKNTLEQQKAANEALIQAEIELQNRRFDAATAGLELLGTLAGQNEKLANVIFAVQKGLEIARIITDTARGIVAAKAGLAAVPPFIGTFPNPAFVKAAIVATKQITGLKIAAASSIASIASTSISKFKGGGGGGAVGGGGGGIDTTAPLAPQLSPQVTATAVNTAAVNQMGNQATRAYVLNSDIQNNDQRNAYINRNASIGNP
jgi:hypothetical protein